MGRDRLRYFAQPRTLYPVPYTLHPTPYALHLSPEIDGTDDTSSRASSPPPTPRRGGPGLAQVIELYESSMAYAVLSTYTLHPASYTLHPTPYTLHVTPYTLHPTPYTLHPASYTLHPTPYTLHPTPYTVNFEPYILNAKTLTLEPLNREFPSGAQGVMKILLSDFDHLPVTASARTALYPYGFAQRRAYQFFTPGPFKNFLRSALCGLAFPQTLGSKFLSCPHSGLRPFYQTSTGFIHSFVGPCVVQSWPHLNSGETNPL